MDELCRICMKKSSSSSNSKKSLDPKIITAIDDIFQTKLDETAFVCSKCRTSLLRFHLFFLETRKNLEIFEKSIETSLTSSVKLEEKPESISILRENVCDAENIEIKPEIMKSEETSECFVWDGPQSTRKRKTTKKKKKVREGPFTCDLCGKSISRFVELRSHIEKIHLRLRKYQCHLCGDNFFASNNLKFHLTTHDNSRPRSQCKICGVLVLDLKKHFKTSHNDSNPVVCNICGKSLMNEMKLRYHTYKRHPPQGKYRCNICDKDFCNALYLKEHTHQKHIGGFLYTCEWCDFQTNYSKNMPTHQKLKHKEEYEARRRARPPMMSRVHEMKATLALQSVTEEN